MWAKSTARIAWACHPPSAPAVHQDVAVAVDRVTRIDDLDGSEAEETLTLARRAIRRATDPEQARDARCGVTGASWCRSGRGEQALTARTGGVS